MKVLDVLGLLVSIFLFLLSVYLFFYGWLNGNDDYYYMLFGVLISIWGIWGAGSLLHEDTKKKGGDRRKQEQKAGAEEEQKGSNGKRR